MQILTSTDGFVRSLEISRPDKKNALTLDMYAALADGIQDAEKDEGIRVILIHAQEDCFTAGNDMKDFVANPPAGPDSPVFRFLRAISGARKPIVAAVAGYAVGIGTTMLLHCDLVYASSNARFKLPFASLGLCPEAASSFLLPLTAGHRMASELLLLGEAFDPEKALAVGIINEVVEEGTVNARAKERAQQLAALPPAAVQTSKRLIKKPLSGIVKEAMGEEAVEFVERLASPEASEAMTAFLEKRKPDFSRFTA